MCSNYSRRKSYELARKIYLKHPPLVEAAVCTLLEILLLWFLSVIMALSYTLILLLRWQKDMLMLRKNIPKV